MSKITFIKNCESHPQNILLRVTDAVTICVEQGITKVKLLELYLLIHKHTLQLIQQLIGRKPSRKIIPNIDKFWVP